MKKVAKWITIIWSIICLIGIFSGMMNVGKNLNRPMTEFETLGAGIGLGLGFGLWFIIWIVIAGPALIIWLVSGKKEDKYFISQRQSTLCPFCKEEIKDGAIKCKHCGSMLDLSNRDLSKNIICPFCKEEIQEGATKCKHCGSILKDSLNSSSTLQSQPPQLLKIHKKYGLSELKKTGGVNRWIVVFVVLGIVCLSGLISYFFTYTGIKKNDLGFESLKSLQSSSSIKEQVQKITLEDIKNSEIGKIKFKNGIFEEKEETPAGTNIVNTCELEKIVLGDLNNDSLEDAAAIMLTSGGGTGVFLSLEIFLNNNGKPLHVVSKDLGDRSDIKVLNIHSGVVTVGGLFHGPNDPLCCPTVEKTMSFNLVKDKGGYLLEEKKQKDLEEMERKKNKEVSIKGTTEDNANKTRSEMSGKQTLARADRGDKPDEIQKQYLERLGRLNLELKSAHMTLLKDSRLSKLQIKREMLELRYRGRLPRDVESQRQEIKDEQTRTESNIKSLEKEKENLKLDALKFYNGKMPDWLATKWQSEESDYSNYLDENYTKKLGEEIGK